MDFWWLVKILDAAYYPASQMSVMKQEPGIDSCVKKLDSISGKNSLNKGPVSGL